MSAERDSNLFSWLQTEIGWHEVYYKNDNFRKWKKNNQKPLYKEVFKELLLFEVI